MKYSSVPNDFFSENRRRILASLPAGSFAVVHSSEIPWKCADGSLHFIQNSDLFFLTGVDQEETMLVLCPGHYDPALREVLFIRETSPLIAIWEGHKLTKEEATAVSGVSSVNWNDQFDEHIRSLARRFDRIFLNYNEHARSASTIGVRPMTVTAAACKPFTQTIASKGSPRCFTRCDRLNPKWKFPG